MTCIIIEDQAPAQRILKKYITDIGNLTLKGTFSNAIYAMDWLNQNEVDLIFLDIHLPKLSGIEFLKSLTNSPKIILTTAFQDYALESYEFDVVDYLLKPFSFQRFVKAISKLKSGQAKVIKPVESVQEDHSFFIKTGHELVRIDPNEIFFIQSDTDYTELHLSHKKHLSSESLKHWLDKLPAPQFVRIHKSYIVNTKRIVKVAYGKVFLEDERSLPIGRVYKEAFMQRFLT